MTNGQLFSKIFAAVTNDSIQLTQLSFAFILLHFPLDQIVRQMEESESYLDEALLLNSVTGFIEYDYITPIEVLTDMLSRIRHRVPNLSDEIEATVTAVQ